jgi:hypothetical protein
MCYKGIAGWGLARRPAIVNPPSRGPPISPRPVYAVTMADETTPTGWADRAGAVLLVLLAAGLLFIGADILSGGKLTGRGGCGCDDTGNGTDS